MAVEDRARQRDELWRGRLAAHSWVDWRDAADWAVRNDTGWTAVARRIGREAIAKLWPLPRRQRV
ncbi:hypothetical protein GCM10023147_36850 [Tsukamurella soli]|uniref:Uncharacterized protein n=1 Tax=Tsukamurella soli TaxID=644556 RepID=A0ABP8K2U1_9ACTN